MTGKPALAFWLPLMPDAAVDVHFATARMTLLRISESAVYWQQQWLARTLLRRFRGPA